MSLSSQDLRGRIPRRVQAPPRFELLDVRDGLILGVEKDALDVQAVSVYRIP